MSSNYDRVKEAYAVLKGEIKERFPPEQYVAIADGKVVADAVTVPELELRLLEIGIRPPDVLVDQVGFDQERIPEYLGWITMNAIVDHWMMCLAVTPNDPPQ